MNLSHDEALDTLLQRCPEAVVHSLTMQISLMQFVESVVDELLHFRGSFIQITRKDLYIGQREKRGREKKSYYNVLRLTQC